LIADGERALDVQSKLGAGPRLLVAGSTGNNDPKHTQSVAPLRSVVPNPVLA